MHVAAIVSFLQKTQEKAPDPNDVVAGWTGFVVFIAMILAVAVIGFALTRSLKTAQRAKDAGVYEEKSQAEGDVSDQAR